MTKNKSRSLGIDGRRVMRRKRDWFRIGWMAAIGSFGLAFAAGAVAGFASYNAVRGGQPSLDPRIDQRPAA